jgi:hypothetical protein
MTQDAWRKGAGRDGRSGHITDQELAEAIAARSKLKFDRNRYQAMFGRGKKIAGGERYLQPIPQPIARAFLDVALKNWSAPAHVTGGGTRSVPDLTPFAGLSLNVINEVIDRAVALMYARDDLEVRCMRVLGLGARGLYRQLGEGGYSVVVVARDGAVRMADPDTQIQDLAGLLNELLCTPTASAVGSVHVWALRRPDIDHLAQADTPAPLVRALRHVGVLRNIVSVVRDMNKIAHARWTKVPLERCLVGISIQTPENHRIFSTEFMAPATSSENLEPNDSIPVFALSPEGTRRFFRFTLAPAPGLAPFVELLDIPSDYGDELQELVALAKQATGGPRAVEGAGWSCMPAVDFSEKWKSSLEEKRK